MKPVAGRQSVGDFRLWGNYTGPGNRTDPEYLEKFPPVDALDAAAKRHDLYYGREAPGRYSYFLHNKADDAFLEDLKDLQGWRARLAEGYFKVKRLVAPRMNEMDVDVTTPSEPFSGKKAWRLKRPYSGGKSTPAKGARLTGPNYSAYGSRKRFGVRPVYGVGFGASSSSFMNAPNPWPVKARRRVEFGSSDAGGSTEGEKFICFICL